VNPFTAIHQNVKNALDEIKKANPRKSQDPAGDPGNDNAGDNADAGE
jgi:hypothetical protein